MEYNEEYKIIFANVDKAAAFDKIAELFYNRNFSSTPKSEIELLMFSIYMDALIEKNKNINGVMDYVRCSDYEIAKQLGLTQERVRNLKLKKQARYPVEFNWQKSLESIKDNIRLEMSTKRIVIPIMDPNLNIEIRNFITSNGGFVDFESGKDYIRIRVEYYLMLMYETLKVEDKKKFNTQIKKILNKANSKEESFSSNEILNNIFDLACKGFPMIASVIQIVNPENTMAKILINLIKTQFKQE